MNDEWRRTLILVGLIVLAVGYMAYMASVQRASL
jgi:hypothetical protein